MRHVMCDSTNKVRNRAVKRTFSLYRVKFRATQGGKVAGTWYVRIWQQKLGVVARTSPHLNRGIKGPCVRKSGLWKKCSGSSNQSRVWAGRWRCTKKRVDPDTCPVRSKTPLDASTYFSLPLNQSCGSPRCGFRGDARTFTIRVCKNGESMFSLGKALVRGSLSLALSH